MGDPFTLVRDEIVERHRFFADWFDGTAGEEDWARCVAAFDPGFRLVSPDGTESTHADLLANLHGRRGAASGDPVAIAIEDVTLVWAGERAALAHYVEVQASRSSISWRRSTALFLIDPVRGALWRHLQETWIHPPADPARGGRQQGDGMR